MNRTGKQNHPDIKHYQDRFAHPWIRPMEILLASLALTLLSPMMLLKLCRQWLKLNPIERIDVYGEKGTIRTLQQFDDESWLGRSPRLLSVINGDIALLGDPLIYSIEGQPDSPFKPGLFSLAASQQRMGLSFENAQIATSQALSSPLRLMMALTRCIATYALSSSRPMNRHSRRFKIMGLTFSNLTMVQVLADINERVMRPRHIGQRSTLTQYAFVNADCVNISHRNATYREQLNRCEHLLADGSGVRLASLWHGFGLKDNLNGTDLFPALCKQASEQGHRIFLLGGQDGIAETAANNMLKRFPELQIAGTHHGFFSDATPIIEQINQSQADILLVAMGAPKQDLWIAEHTSQLNVAIAIGVGGLFDFYSNRISRAPMWLRHIGMEWIWRLVQEPQRMWRRYILGNPIFLWRAFQSANNQMHDKRNAAIQFEMPTSLQHHNIRAVKAIFTRRLQRANIAISQISKRILDICASALLLMLLSPLLCLITVLIRLESPGAALYSQQRAGKNNQAFTMWKFRSMYQDADHRLKKLQQNNEMKGGVLFKMKQDPRITRIGKFIRKASIDELPQLWNVLKGDMSLVGPRPALLSEVAQYETHQRQRLAVKPGITCIWQVSGRSDIPFAQQVELDVEYIHQQSLKADVMLLIKTIPAVVLARGAY
ncbi:exopolysaccharide biosynthesis polyprenyl glycosylphosphotransferase [Shewanella gelidii]|uniref:Bacterial sugar transferase domain-containing protein n=1 Tax=Shewanella gelidii TaxID=1642821 RepID=A0A917JGJ8_9GAMM|nr:exopolysaccharide biosynthesis polyprenyl glycosylphosphotransferase [Shewanella gelidii]MCL1096409.1 exopolysaccharide biosynthesis polyprenyl glycosylphosphotransferase [Shewanella gelidii]GGI67227.1 hypothetical protein GCM10009332_00370 [Shewanella gelidii]